MKEKSKRSVSIIGGADGPTSVFIVGKSGKKPLKMRIKNYIYKCKRKKAEKKIFAGAHSIEEVVVYAKDKYLAVEIGTTQNKYVEQRKCLKESLILEQKPELLGDMEDIKRPNIYDEDSIWKLHQQIEARSEIIAQIPDSEMPMDFHLFEIRLDDGVLEIGTEYIWDIFGVSYSGNKKVMKQLKRIAQDLYIYYGVTEEDIRNKSKRYSSLLTTLST